MVHAGAGAWTCGSPTRGDNSVAVRGQGRYRRRVSTTLATSPETVAATQRRSVRTLSAAAMAGGIATAGAIPAGALIAASLASDAVAGLAQTAGVVGAAVLALPLARIALNRGRRAALTLGYSLGAVGAVVVVVAGATGSLPLVFVGCFFVGVASAAGLQARYAATDLALPTHRARALATVVWAGTVGAVLGPNLLGLSGRAAVSLGLPQLTGPYLTAALMLAIAVTVLQMALRPDPYLLSRDLTQETTGVVAPKARLRDGIEHLRRHRRAVLGVCSLSLGHVVMVMVMVMTPVHMRHVDVSLPLIGFVISVHVLGMYAFSPVVGWLVDRFGRVPMILVGTAILMVACIVCGLAPSDSVPVLAVGLFLLGLGWSFTLIGGSTLVTDDVDEGERPSVQGLSDLCMNVAAAGGGAVAGFIVAGASYAVLCAVATVPVLALVVLALSPAMRRPALPSA